jgi:hypothetical protein
LIEELSNWKPGMNLPDIPVEEVSEELERHLRETNFQVILNFDAKNLFNISNRRSTQN